MQPSVQAAEKIDCKLRFLWGSSTPRSFSGSIALTSGVLRHERNLSLEADSIGRVRSKSPQVLQIAPHSPSTFGGFDFSIAATPDARLTIRAKDPVTGETTEQSATISQLLQGQWIKPLDAQGARFAIERQVSDRLQVDSDHPSGIFRPGDPWNLRITGNHTGLEAGQYNLHVGFEIGEYSETRDVRVDESGNFPLQLFEANVPQAPGGSQLSIRLSRKRFLDPLRTATPLLVRRVDVVVLNDQSTPQQITGWTPLATINALQASQPGSIAWLAPRELRDAINAQPVSEVATYLQQYNPLAGKFAVPQSFGTLSARMLPEAAHREVGQQDCLAITPGSWLAIPLDGLQPGVPHRLRVRYPTDQPMNLAISLRQADPKSTPRNIDSAVHVGVRNCDPDAPIYEHDVLFWPEQERSFAVLANADPLWNASVATVSVEVANFTAQAVQPTSGRRSVGVYLDRPLLADAVAAPREADPTVSRQYESWQTWYLAVQRLMQTMSWNQSNTLFVKVQGQGGTIFPSSILQPTTRFDGGAFFTDGRSPDAKDVVELLLRAADQHAHRVVLTLSLDTELPRLARQFAATDSATRRANFTQQPFSPEQTHAWTSDPAVSKIARYNPLNKAVATEIRAVIDDIAQRYAHHESFAGIALQIDRNSQLVFAGDRWGYDTISFEQFQASVGARFPENEVAATIFSQAAIRQRFLQWRASELTKTFSELASAVTHRKPTARLYIAPAKLWETPPGRDEFFEPEMVLRNPQSMLLACGLDPAELSQVPGLRWVGGAWPHNVATVDSTRWLLSDSSRWDLHNVTSPSVATTAIQKPTQHIPIQLASAGADQGTAWLYPAASGHGRHSVKDVIDALHRSDTTELVTGGWSLRQGDGEALRDIFETLTTLPPICLHTHKMTDDETNLRIRTGTHDGNTYVHLINNAAWPERVTVSLQYPSDSVARELGPQSARLSIPRAGRQLNPDNHTWIVELAPYDMAAIQIDSPGATLVGIQRSGDQEASSRIARELQHLEEIVAQAGDPTLRRTLANLEGDFERWTTEARPSGWTLSALPRVDIVQSNEFPRSGRSCLAITNKGRSKTSAWIQSQAIAPPATGRLMVSAWLRTAATSGPVLVRLTIHGRTTAGEKFERSRAFGGLSQNRTRLPVDWGRKPIQLNVSDIPIDQIDSLHVSLELVGEGKIWIDDIEIFEMILQPDERNHLRGQLLVAKERLKKGNPFAAETLLAGHWGQYIRGVQHRAAAYEHPVSQTPATNRSASSWNNTTPVFQRWRNSIKQYWNH